MPLVDLPKVLWFGRISSSTHKTKTPPAVHLTWTWHFQSPLECTLFSQRTLNDSQFKFQKFASSSNPNLCLKFQSPNSCQINHKNFKFSIQILFLPKINKLLDFLIFNQVEIRFMLLKLKQWNQQIGGSQSKRALAASEFDFLQQEFLAKRHEVQKAQDIKQKEGITKANPNIGYEIREGISKMKEIIEKLRDQHRRLTKKKKDTPEILQRKLKIVQNCELLLKDLQDRQNGEAPKNTNKATTLTDLKAKLLHQIDQNNQKIHDVHSDNHLTSPNDEQILQMKKWKQKDQQMDIIVDDIITGVKVIKGKVKQINEHQDIINQKTKKADQKITKVSQRIQKDNDSLKVIIKKFKKSRCCLFIALFLLLAGLIVCVIKLLI